MPKNPWPGTPQSQQSPPINPPSMRHPFTLNEESSMKDVVDTLRRISNKTVDYDQAFANLPKAVATQATVAATAAVENISSEITAGVISFNSQTGAVIYFPNLGRVNDQLGNLVYVTQNSDAGQKIIVGDSTPVTVNLNPNVTIPWFAFVGNDSTAFANFQTDSGAVIAGITSIYPGGNAIVFYDGTTFWCEGAAIATDSSMGVVQPDGVTINVDSGVIFTQVSAGLGSPSSHPSTPGNPFYFDSTASPWHGYVWLGNQWNRFS